MQYKVVRVNAGEFNIEENFWDLNPQWKYITPFSDLYKKDRSKNKEKSSKYMWCIWMLKDPSYDNKVYRQEEETQNTILSQYNPDFDREDEYTQELMDLYPSIGVTPAGRSFMESEESLKTRTYIMRTSYNELKRRVEDNPLALVDKDMQSLMAKLDKMHIDTQKIYENYEQVRKKFEDDESSKARIYGNREETIREKGVLIQDIPDETLDDFE